MAVYLYPVRFSPPGSVPLPCCDGRDEESSVHRAQPPRPYQQLSVSRLPDMSPAHPHQVTLHFHTHLFSTPPFKDRRLCRRLFNCLFSDGLVTMTNIFLISLFPKGKSTLLNFGVLLKIISCCCSFCATVIWPGPSI